MLINLHMILFTPVTGISLYMLVILCFSVGFQSLELYVHTCVLGCLMYGSGNHVTHVLMNWLGILSQKLSFCW